MSPNSNQRPRLTRSSAESSYPVDSGILNERILLLVFESIKWDIRVVCQMASVCRKLRALSKRLLWREVCLYRAPRMITALSDGVPSSSRMGDGWHALAKLLFFCSGCVSTQHFKLRGDSPAHFVRESRFSKTSGRSFLIKKCRGDLLFVSDPCEHVMGEIEDDLGIFRGVFKGFMRSRTRACLIRRQVELEERVRCPYCGSRVWSMSAAGLVPKSAARRLGAQDGGLEYFVCVNGHLHGACWLVPLSSDEDGKYLDEEEEEEAEAEEEAEEEEEDEDEIGRFHGGSHRNGLDNYRRSNGSLDCVKNGPTSMKN